MDGGEGLSLVSVDGLSPKSSQIAPATAISLPPVEILCPFEDQDTHERHVINNAVIVPCCGYFICCDTCKSFLFKF